MRELKAKISRVAASPFPVVIEGESGTGKELIARAIHGEGPRGRAVFVPVNCAVLGDELFESGLFGHTKGAFTGAAQDRKGLLEVSSGGTVFLDEVAELTPRAQAKLLRVLQDGEIRRLSLGVDVRPCNDSVPCGAVQQKLTPFLQATPLTVWRTTPGVAENEIMVPP